jgi:hypothetical protein
MHRGELLSESEEDGEEEDWETGLRCEPWICCEGMEEVDRIQQWWRVGCVSTLSMGEGLGWIVA